MTILFSCDIIHKRALKKAQFGGLAQLARAPGSYPVGRWFKSDIRYQNRPVGQEVKTRPFHGCNMGSIPVRVTNPEKSTTRVVLFSFRDGWPVRPRTQRRSRRVRIIASSSPVETSQDEANSRVSWLNDKFLHQSRRKHHACGAFFFLGIGEPYVIKRGRIYPFAPPL